jgi:hypothetical protein
MFDLLDVKELEGVLVGEAKLRISLQSIRHQLLEVLYSLFLKAKETYICLVGRKFDEKYAKAYTYMIR